MSPIPLWRLLQRQNLTSLSDLADFLELSPDQRQRLLKNPTFPLNLPRRIAQKIAKRTLDDPLLLQFVPLSQEALSSTDFCIDPVEDLASRRQRKLLHKYHGRVLILASSACAMHCRFCFRQNFPYETQDRDFSKELRLIREDSSIHEVILSGGDPLSLSNESLHALFLELATIPHVHRVRLHSRFPIGIPERIDDELIAMLSKHPQQILFVLHVNHGAELDHDVLQALRRMQLLGIPLLSQSVLLKSVNDDEKTLRSLFETLINAGIIPYYLHLLDRVAGSAHFEVAADLGRRLIQDLQNHLPGYAIPRLVQEVAGRPSKTYI
jgi:EF-P beta-lysylation protein EpmB